MVRWNAYSSYSSLMNIRFRTLRVRRVVARSLKRYRSTQLSSHSPEHKYNVFCRWIIHRMTHENSDILWILEIWTQMPIFVRSCLSSLLNAKPQLDTAALQSLFGMSPSRNFEREHRGSFGGRSESGSVSRVARMYIFIFQTSVRLQV